MHHSSCVFGTLIALQAVVLVQPKEVDLSYYDASNRTQVNLVKKWYNFIMKVKHEMKDEETAMTLLEKESCRNQSTFRCQYFAVTKDYNKTVPGLWRAECIAVTMYSGAFYVEYNKASNNTEWEPYQRYTYLLWSALRKLRKNPKYNVSDTVTLYRGLQTKHPKPKASRLFWKAFTSTSLDIHVMMMFGTQTKLVFKPPATIYGAKIQDLSFYPSESEVLLPPFECFDVLHEYNETTNTMYFRSSGIKMADLSDDDFETSEIEDTEEEEVEVEADYVEIEAEYAEAQAQYAEAQAQYGEEYAYDAAIKTTFRVHLLIILTLSAFV